ncbi:hypothetical protein ACSBR2_017377 [Camellia fascicularis]
MLNVISDMGHCFKLVWLRLITTYSNKKETISSAILHRASSRFLENKVCFNIMGCSINTSRT